MENFNSIQELSIDSLVEINGGTISTKSIVIGAVASAANPIVGLGYWVGYIVNS